MYRSPHKFLMHRIAYMVSGWWINARFYWYTTSKTPLILLLLTAAIGGSLFAGGSYLIDSMFTSKEDNRSLTCLALNVFYEARGEPLAGQYAVAEVTMNRVASRRFPGTVCGVVYQKTWDPLRKRYVGAFSWTEFEQLPAPKGEHWERAWRVAEAVYAGRYEPQLGGALHYHAVYLRPSWSTERKRIAQIGNHIFYR